MTDITTAELRKRTLKNQGLIPPQKRPFFLPDPEQYDESSVDYPKSALMKYIESKYNIILKLDIYRGSINDVCSRYNWEVDRATISRWRKHIRRFLIK